MTEAEIDILARSEATRLYSTACTDISSLYRPAVSPITPGTKPNIVFSEGLKMKYLPQLRRRHQRRYPNVVLGLVSRESPNLVLDGQVELMKYASCWVDNWYALLQTTTVNAQLNGTFLQPKSTWTRDPDRPLCS